MEQAGLAQRQAQEIEKARLEAEVEKKQKEIQNQRNARSRGANALAKEKRLQEEKKELEEQVKQIERKKMIFAQETELAHEQAKQYQREVLEKTQNASVVDHGDVSAISRLLNRPMLDGTNTQASNASFATGIDYNNSRFHNTLLGRNDTTLVVSETLRAQTEKRAFDKAKEQEVQKNIKRAH